MFPLVNPGSATVEYVIFTQKTKNGHLLVWDDVFDYWLARVNSVEQIRLLRGNTNLHQPILQIRLSVSDKLRMSQSESHCNGVSHICCVHEQDNVAKWSFLIKMPWPFVWCHLWKLAGEIRCHAILLKKLKFSLEPIVFITKKHSSRMRAARLLTVGVCRLGGAVLLVLCLGWLWCCP